MKSKSTSLKQPWRNSMFTSPISKYSRFLPSISGQSSESSVSPIFATYSPQFVGATEFHPKEIADFNSISASPSQGQVKLRLRRPQWRRVELAPKGQKLGLASPGGRTWTLGYGYVMNMWILWMCTSFRNFGSFCCRIEHDRTCITCVWISNGLINRPLTWDMRAG